MSKPATKAPPPDQLERERALDPSNSILVQAPAGSGKTDLLTRRFLRLLTEVADPSQIVAITFTKAAAAEMRHRILSKLEEAAANSNPHPDPGLFSMESLARRALLHSQALGWNLLDQPAQLRISTIDSFCREIALQQPLLSGLGGGLDIYEQPDELYRRAARQTLNEIDSADPALRSSIETLLLWRDNNWSEMEDQLVEMLRNRDRWMQDFVLVRDLDHEPDEAQLRQRLERPFSRTISTALTHLSRLLDQVASAREEALTLARFGCQNGALALFQGLAELADFPSADSADAAVLEETHHAYLCLATLLLTNGGNFRKRVDKSIGFPADRKREKAQLLDLISRLSTIPGLESALAAARTLPRPRYTEEDWQIVRSCFTVLRRAAAELRVVFAEAGAVDYIEVAQIALNVLQGADGLPSDAAISLADAIRHILVDEFQDTSRRQHELLRRLIAAWPEREGRSCFVVGDPMQSIYFFRDADAELFPRVKSTGLEIPNAEPFLFHPVALTSNFRTAPPLVARLNNTFEKVFAANDGSGITFSPAEPARDTEAGPRQHFELHIKFQPQLSRAQSATIESIKDSEALRSAQVEEIVAVIRSHAERIKNARAKVKNYRVAVLGRTRNALAPIAQALRKAEIPFRAVDLEKLSARPEVLDALSLARAILNPLDRVAWLGVLRAPWCGLSLQDLHTLTSADDDELAARPVPELLGERFHLLSNEGRSAAERVLQAIAAAPALRFSLPTASLGTWLEQLWLLLGGAQCVDAAARANLNLLWQTLDSLPNSEQDLLGPALQEALQDLTAQPDPASDSNCGVQLMTIHKSKGLEFEVVIVPELQARSGKVTIRMLSWLERGLPSEDTAGLPGDSDEITEFLVAPLQSKGADRGTTKQWVDRVYSERERQETRRILYVATTRAREELHLFARPTCKKDNDGSWVLAEPSSSLLATAWPALEAEVRRQFDEWKAAIADSQAQPTTIDSIAAAGESNLLVMPVPSRPTLLRRLPPGYQPDQAAATAVIARQIPSVTGITSETAQNALYARHEGGLLSRALGTAVHTLLEHLARLRSTNDWQASRAALHQLEPAVAAQIRAVGVDPNNAATLAAEAFRLALNTTNDPTGQWILSPHAGGASEVRWVGVIAGNLRTVQVDRVFRAAHDPLSDGDHAWWIIDYKTAHADGPEGVAPATMLPQLREIFAPQLAAYAQILRNMHGEGAPIHAGLYYPRMLLFDWWEI